MKSSLGMKLLMMVTASLGFSSYLLGLTVPNIEQFIAVAAIITFDGIFGIIAGIKREGFKTYKALRIIRTLAMWEIILTLILMVEKGFTGTGWLSETIIAPFITFQLISALKNASMAGYIKNELLNFILDKIDSHKGIRISDISPTNNKK